MELIKKDLEENKIVRKHKNNSKNIFLNSPERERINSVLKSPNAE